MTAAESSTQLLAVYNDLTESTLAHDLEEWRKAEAHAMTARGKALKIFDLPLMNGMHIQYRYLCSPELYHQSGPSQAQVTTMLHQQERLQALPDSIVNVIAEGIALETTRWAQLS